MVQVTTLLTRAGLSKKRRDFAASRERIHNSLDAELKSVFSRVIKNLSPIGMKGRQSNSLKAFLCTAEGELEQEFRRTLSDALYGLPSAQRDGDSGRIDMFSIEGFEQALRQLKKRKNAPDLDDELLFSAVPRPSAKCCSS